MITFEDRKLLVEFMGREIKQDSDLGDLEHSLPIEFMFEVLKKIQFQYPDKKVVIYMKQDSNNVLIYGENESWHGRHEDFAMAAALAALQVIRLNKEYGSI